MGAGGALQGWQRSGAKWQNFEVDGKISKSIE